METTSDLSAALRESRVWAIGGSTAVALGTIDDGRTLVEYAKEHGLAVVPFYRDQPGHRVSRPGHRVSRPGDAGDGIVYVSAAADLSGPIKVTAEDMYVETPAGTALADVKEAVAHKAPALWLPVLCEDERTTVGELLETYPPNPLAPIYGELPRTVLGVEGLLGTGDFIVCGRRTVKGVTGYDLTGLFVGSRGRLGLITRVRFRLWARPPRQAVLASGDAVGPGLAESRHLRRAVAFTFDERPALYVEGPSEKIKASRRDISELTGRGWAVAAEGEKALAILREHFDAPELMPDGSPGPGGLLDELGGPFNISASVKT